jgi:hypothetical protein
MFTNCTMNGWNGRFHLCWALATSLQGKACLQPQQKPTLRPTEKKGIELRACLLYTRIRFNLANGGDQWPK